MIPKIVKATQRDGWIDLILHDVDEEGKQIGDEYGYTLYENDPYGVAPDLRKKLADGSIEIEDGRV